MKKMIDMLDLMKRVSNVTVKFGLGALIASSPQVEALNTWEGGTSTDLSVAGNWSANAVPGPSDTGYFSSSGNPAPTLMNSESVDAGSFDFTDSTQFTFNLNNTSSLSFEGLGVQNVTSTSQIFNLNNDATLTFINESSSDNSTINILEGGCQLNYNNVSTADSSVINATNGSTVSFNNSSNAGTALITCDGNISGNSTLLTFNSQSNAASSQIFATNGAEIDFNNFSSASSATINVNDSTITFSSINLTGSGPITLANSSQMNINFANTTLGPLTTDPSSIVTIRSSELTINTDQNTTISGPITDDGFGSFVKTGPGKLSLNGVNTYQEGTTVFQGNLAINNSTAGNVFVEAGGTLSGIGNIARYLLNEGGTVAPGNNNTGTLTVQLGFEQTQSDSIFLTTVEGNNSSLLEVGQFASLDGIVQVLVPNGKFNVNQTYTILHANDGLFNTTFSNVYSLTPGIIPTLSYDSNNVFLRLRHNLGGLAVNPNQRNVAAQIDSITNPTTDEAAVINSILASNNSLDSLDSLAGEQYTSFFQISQYQDHRFGRRLFVSFRDLLSPYFCQNPCGFEVWSAIEGGRSFAQGNRNAKGYNGTNVDYSLGAHINGQNYFFGIAGNYEYDYISFNQSATTNINTGQGGLYAGLTSEKIYLFADLIVGISEARMHREMYVGEIHPKLSSTNNFTTNHGNFYSELGANLAFERVLIQPFGGLDAGCIDRRQIRENGSSSFNLFVNSKTNTFFDTFLGAHLISGYKCITVEADLAWQHLFYSKPQTFTANFIDFGSAFPIIGSSLGKNGIRYAVLISAPVKAGAYDLNAFLDFSGEYWKNWNSYNLAAGVKFSW